MKSSFQEFSVVEKRWDITDTFFLKLKPNKTFPLFKDGQTVIIKNPKFRDKEEQHKFLITSSGDAFVEVYIQITDDWTRYTSKIVKNDVLLLRLSDS